MGYVLPQSDKPMPLENYEISKNHERCAIWQDLRGKQTISRFTDGTVPRRNQGDLTNRPIPYTHLQSPLFQRPFSQMFRYSTFIGGPWCNWNPISPPTARFVASSSIATAIRRPFRTCVSAFPRAMMWS